MNSETQNSVRHDTLNRFLFEKHDIRGELVNLQSTYQAILNCHDYPVAVQRLLGELLVATSLLTATLKFEGDITVQVQGDGPVQFAVINGNHKQQMRGLARYEGEIAPDATLKEMIGKGILVITIMPTQGERYQGIVGLEGETIAECLEAYFKQSEQLATQLVIRVGVLDQKPFAAGLLLQLLPTKTTEETLNTFEHLSVLAMTVKAEELFSLSTFEVLHRLFHEEDVRLFQSQPVSFQCRCSRQKCEETLMTLPESELQAILAEEGSIDMTCDYCNSKYVFDKVDIAHLEKKKQEPLKVH